METQVPDPVIGEALHRFRSLVIESMGTIRYHWWRVGLALQPIHDLELWREEADSFSAFLADPAIDMSESTGLRLCRVIDRFKPLLDKGLITEQHMRNLGIAKADMIQGILEDANDDVMLEWIDKAANLSQMALSTEVKRHRSGQPIEVVDLTEEVSDQLVRLARRLVGADDPMSVLDEMLQAIAHAKTRFADYMATPD